MRKKTTHKNKSRKRGPVRSRKVIFDGITFASGLERYMYQALKKAKIRCDYEGRTFTLVEGFNFDNETYERQTNGKGEMVNRGCKKILPIKYTPDFIGKEFIIETKGRANESFPMRWKLFKKMINRMYPHVTLYKPQNQKECDRVVELIINKRKNI
jgi:hypothetical protein|tara:strand:+ start:657 stop:1124 length:468 start_codon:yes stop_codon:yes gene_type:complete